MVFGFSSAVRFPVPPYAYKLSMEIVNSQFVIEEIEVLSEILFDFFLCSECGEERVSIRMAKNVSIDINKVKWKPEEIANFLL